MVENINSVELQKQLGVSGEISLTTERIIAPQQMSRVNVDRPVSGSIATGAWRGVYFDASRRRCDVVMQIGSQENELFGTVKINSQGIHESPEFFGTFKGAFTNGTVTFDFYPNEMKAPQIVFHVDATWVSLGGAPVEYQSIYGIVTPQGIVDKTKGGVWMIWNVL